jgi:hypothetical protein
MINFVFWQADLSQWSLLLVIIVGRKNEYSDVITTVHSTNCSHLIMEMFPLCTSSIQNGFGQAIHLYPVYSRF